MEHVLDAKTFKETRRDLLIDYEAYRREFIEVQEGYTITRQSPYHTPEAIDSSLLYSISVSRRRRAWDGLNQLTLAYSAGHPVSELQAFFPTVLAWWEDYAMWDKAYDDSPAATGSYVAHLALLGDDYHRANRLVCFAILLGFQNLLPRLLSIIDYRNPHSDGMLERLVAPFAPGRGTPPDECTRHLPYFKTLKIFAAAAAKRPAMMATYLQDWYHASRREPYYNSHERGMDFFGYWSWESAAITFLLDIDDHSYRDAQFYPRALIDFAKANQTAPSCSSAPGVPDELRAKAGDPCPRAGQWQSVDVPHQTRSYKLDEPMADLKSAYGMTVWRYMKP